MSSDHPLESRHVDYESRDFIRQTMAPNSNVNRTLQLNIPRKVNKYGGQFRGAKYEPNYLYIIIATIG